MGNADADAPLARILAPDDPRHEHFAAQIGNTQALWDDRSLFNPLQHYAYTYMNPDNVIFDICGGEGLFAVTQIVPGLRGQCIGALWTRRAVRATHDGTLWRACGLAAMETKQLIVLDAFTAIDNRLARRLNERMGMTLRGFVPEAMWYNGVSKAAAWYEIDRPTLEALSAIQPRGRSSNGQSIPGQREQATGDRTGVRVPDESVGAVRPAGPAAVGRDLQRVV